MKRILSLTAILLMCATPLFARMSAEQKAKQIEDVKAGIRNGVIKIEVDRMIPFAGSVRSVSSRYSLEIRSDSVFSYLPYYGEAHRLPYGGGEGMIFDAPVTNYQVKVKEKGMTEIKFDTKTFEDNYTFFIDISENGMSSIHVRPLNKDSITYTGQMETGDSQTVKKDKKRK